MFMLYLFWILESKRMKGNIENAMGADNMEFFTTYMYSICLIILKVINEHIYKVFYPFVSNKKT